MKEKRAKKRITRRLFSVVLALAMVLSLMPMNSTTVYAKCTIGTCGICGHSSNNHYVKRGSADAALTNAMVNDDSIVSRCLECDSLDAPCIGTSWGDCLNYSSGGSGGSGESGGETTHEYGGPTTLFGVEITVTGNSWHYEEYGAWICCEGDMLEIWPDDEELSIYASSSDTLYIKIQESSSSNYSCDYCGATISWENHIHTYSTEWTSDETQHWHAANCEHTSETSDVANHNWGAWNTEDAVSTRSCTVCSREETCYHDGQTGEACSVCGKTLRPAHINYLDDILAKMEGKECISLLEVIDGDYYTLASGYSDVKAELEKMADDITSIIEYDSNVLVYVGELEYSVNIYDAEHEFDGNECVFCGYTFTKHGTGYECTSGNFYWPDADAGWVCIYEALKVGDILSAGMEAGYGSAFTDGTVILDDETLDIGVPLTTNAKIVAIDNANGIITLVSIPHEHDFSEYYNSDDDYHWHYCMGDGATDDCLNAEGAGKEAHTVVGTVSCSEGQTCSVCYSQVAAPLGHDWVDGKCTRCPLICSHYINEDGVCSDCGKVLNDSDPLPYPEFTCTDETHAEHVYVYAVENGRVYAFDYMVFGEFSTVRHADMRIDSCGIESPEAGTWYYYGRESNGVCENAGSSESQKAEGPEAPTDLVPYRPTTFGGSDGKILGVDETMEYSTDDGETWTDVSGTAITDLEPGTILVRVKETETAKAGASASVEILSHIALIYVQEMGKWCLYEGGQLKEDYTGLFYRGDFFYIENGIYNKEYEGLTEYNGTLWYVKNGKLDKTFKGLADYQGTKIFTRDGKASYETGIYVDEDGVSYYIVDGLIDTTKTGLFYDSKVGAWKYFVEGVQAKASKGLVWHGNAWYYVANGVLDKSYAGLVWHGNAWYYVSGGKLDKSYAGLTNYGGKLWYVSDGKLNKEFAGDVEYKGAEYTVANGIGTAK